MTICDKCIHKEVCEWSPNFDQVCTDYLEERPKGEWISNYQGESFMNRGRHCSLCGKCVEFSENFCPQCGADMRGKANDVR